MHPQKYKHLFFDLDRTLWDFDKNNDATFHELYNHFQLKAKGVENFETFYRSYKIINLELWDRYKKQEITKETLNFSRFYDTLRKFHIDNGELAREMGAFYVSKSPLKTALYPGTFEILEELQRNYQLHIITNGFEEVQFIKLKKSGLDKYFKSIITSERAGFKKPDPEIFHFALQETGASIEESIIIGDDPEADISGGKQIGMDQIWVKHPPLKPANGKATFEVDRLSQIMKIL